MISKFPLLACLLFPVSCTSMNISEQLYTLFCALNTATGLSSSSSKKTPDDSTRKKVTFKDQPTRTSEHSLPSKNT